MFIPTLSKIAQNGEKNQMSTSEWTIGGNSYNEILPSNKKGYPITFLYTGNEPVQHEI